MNLKMFVILSSGPSKPNGCGCSQVPGGQEEFLAANSLVWLMFYLKKNIRFFSILHSRLCPCLFLKSVSGWFIAANNVKCKTLKVVKIKSKGEIGRLKVFEYLGCYYLCASIFTSTSRLCSRVALTDWTGLRTAALTLMDGSGMIFILVVSNVMPLLMEFKKLLIRGHYDTYRVCFVVTSHVFRDFFEYSFTRRHLKRLVGWWREGCKRWP